MKAKRLLATGALVTAGALALSGCSAPTRNTEIVENSSITVAWNDPYFALNGDLTNTNAVANNLVNYMVQAQAMYYDPTPTLQYNKDYITVEKISDDPLTVKYTVQSGVKWTDGQPVDAADMLLRWAAGVTHRGDDANSDDVKNEDGEIDESTVAGKVIWGTGPVAGYGLDAVEEVPEIGDEGRSITLVYTKPYVDWELAMGHSVANISAAATVQLAYPDKYTGEDGAAQAKKDLIKAIQDDDREFLAPVAKAYREGFIFQDGMPANPDLQFVSNGAYKIKYIEKDSYVTLEANPDYTWGPKPKYSEITVRAINDPQAQVDALENGDVQIASAQPTVDLLQKLAQSDSIKYETGQEGAYEHIDIQTKGGGIFDPSVTGEEKSKLLREAFLQTVPRQEIIDKLIAPLEPKAEVRKSLLFLPGSENYSDAAEQSGFAFYNGDIAKAKELIAQSGVSNPKVRVLYASTNPRRASEFQLIKAKAEEAGFIVEDAGLAQWAPALAGAPDTYDVAFFAWASPSLAIGESGANFQTTGLNNFYGWSDPEVDRLFDELGQQSDPAKQKEILIKAEKLIAKNAWSLPLFQFPGATAWSKKVEGVKAGFLSPYYVWNYWEWKPVTTDEDDEKSE